MFESLPQSSTVIDSRICETFLKKNWPRNVEEKIDKTWLAEMVSFFLENHERSEDNL